VAYGIQGPGFRLKLQTDGRGDDTNRARREPSSYYLPYLYPHTVAHLLLSSMTRFAGLLQLTMDFIFSPNLLPISRLLCHDSQGIVIRQLPSVECPIRVCHGILHVDTELRVQATEQRSGPQYNIEFFQTMTML
jgi:hypothetical protein